MATGSKTTARRPSAQPGDFFEALKQLGTDVKKDISDTKVQVRKMFTDDVPEMFGIAPSSGPSSGSLNPNESISIADLQNKAKAEGYAQGMSEANAQNHQLKEEERAFYMRKEAEKKQEITALRQEILALAKSAGALGKEVEIAAVQSVVNPGAYHKNFFYHLRSLVQTLRKQVEHSRHWLQTTNQRAKKKGFYWSQVKKSGTSFMLSSERYAVTSTG